MRTGGGKRRGVELEVLTGTLHEIEQVCEEENPVELEVLTGTLHEIIRICEEENPVELGA